MSGARTRANSRVSAVRAAAIQTGGMLASAATAAAALYVIYQYDNSAVLPPPLA